MMNCGLTKDFGVMASDSAQYIADQGKISFDTPKLSSVNGKYLVSYIGTNLYFHSMDLSKFGLKLDQLSLYLQKYLRETKPDVEALMKENIKDVDEQKPNLCMYVMGIHGQFPTLAQFNSFNDFKPRYLWSENGLKFSSILYGDDSKPEKQEIFKESTRFMEAEAKRIGSDSPGLVGEILTRGIYKKADLEMKIGLKKKYAGGTVSVAVLKKDGTMYSPSAVEVLNGHS